MQRLFMIVFRCSSLQHLAGISILAAIILCQLAFNIADPAARVLTIFQNDARQLHTQIQRLNQAATEYQSGRISLEGLRREVGATRDVFKQVEYLLEFYYPAYIKEYVNGPPLYHPDAFAYLSIPAIVAPRGLQVLDERVSEDSVSSAGIVALAGELETRYTILLQMVLKRKYVQDFEVFEAARLELVRIYTLGISGFDTPGSLRALDETSVALAGMQRGIAPFYEKLPDSTSLRVQTLFSGAIDFVRNNRGFESFDRLAFLTRYINPLYKALRDAHQQITDKTTAGVTGEVSSWNAASDNLFDDNFLNPYYYSLLKREQDSEALRLLGKQLFYDVRLSDNQTMSCGSCHKPGLAFADGTDRSAASVAGKQVQRNAPSLINVIFADRYFYDLRAFDLEEQAEHVIENHMEFNTSFPAMLGRINGDAHYRQAFESVFHTPSVSRHQFSAALASYVLSLRAFSSPFDRYVRGEASDLPDQVKKGFNLFMGKAACGTCHYPPTFSGLVPPLYHESETEVLGVLAGPGMKVIDNDAGRSDNGVLNESAPLYRRAFKTTSVRNAAVTAPYFHNGAYSTLEQVLDFYNNGGAAGVGLAYEVPNQTLSQDHLNLSRAESRAIIAFIRSLTDTTIVNPSYR